MGLRGLERCQPVNMPVRGQLRGVFHLTGVT